MGSEPISVAMLKMLLSADFEAGRLFWKARTPDLFTDGGHTAQHTCAKWNSKNAGYEAFTCLSDGRFEGRIFRRLYRAHRVLWALHSGSWPALEIDHINRNPSDNRIENLRECSHAENTMNRSANRSGTSNFLGVHFDRRRGAWIASICPNRKHIHLGRFSSEVSAAMAYDVAAKIHYGKFANLNFPELPLIERNAA